MKTLRLVTPEVELSIVGIARMTLVGTDVNPALAAWDGTGELVGIFSPEAPGYCWLAEEEVEKGTEA